jgi:hypothetical protein
MARQPAFTCGAGEAVAGDKSIVTAIAEPIILKDIMFAVWAVGVKSY